MFRYLIRRLIWACVLFVAVTIVTYVIFYAIPADPARLACGQRATPECIKRAAHYLGTDRPLYVQYGKFFGRLMPVGIAGGAALQDAEPRPLVHEPAERQLRRPERRAGDRVARLRRRHLLDADRAARRHPLGAPAAIAARPNSHGVRARRHLAHPVWIGLIFAYFFGFKAGIFPITGYCDFFNCGQRSRAGAVGLPPRPAVGDVRDPVRRALRADDPRERDGGARGGLRPHRARQGRAGVARHALARAAQRAAAGRDDARHGHRHRARRRDLHRVGLRAAGARQDRDQGDRVLRPADDAGGGRFRDPCIIVFNLVVDSALRRRSIPVSGSS